MNTAWMTRLHSDDTGKLLLRLAVGGLMLFHGVSKVQSGVGWMVDMLRGKGLPGPLAYGSYVGEVVAPILILLGLFTRPAGLLVAFTMVMAVGLVHMGDLAKLTPHGGWALELQAFYFLGGVCLFFTGAGRYSVTRGRGAFN